ncbi:efflux RND transporter periplasmic adaptor subunit [Vibrio maerlii]|uniref:efflux RND transporter periplasmic adaptor subunit n=1 Tax=Vibrio maerlii TaxID=2231648 RepID=UPI000E3D7929|nr:efflux RND transporter periplasmic adaptor subunit [Vibrio maerlii]
MKSSQFRMKPIAKWLAVGVLGLSLIGCNDAISEESVAVVTPVKLVEIPDVSKDHVDSFIAKVDATERATLSFQVAGEISGITVNMGAHVRKGQELAMLDPTDYQLALDAKQAEFELAETAFKRSEQLYIKRLISTDEFDRTETSYKAARAALDQAKTDLSYTRISAPYDGVISLAFAKEHQVVGASQPILNVIDNQVLDVVFTVPVTYIEKNGIDHFYSTALTVTPDSRRDLKIPAIFKEISTQPNQDTNSYSATLTIERPEQVNLLSGMTGLVSVYKSQDDIGIAISESAWVEKEGSKGELFRFDPKNSSLQKIEVTLDESGKVIGGLNTGDLIVEAGVGKLYEGQEVKPWKKEGGI